MTYTSKQKTFYAKRFEEVLRNYFKCPSKTPSGKPFPYLFIHNKENPTHVFRNKDNGMSDVYMKSIIDKTDIQEKFITFFPFYNGYDEFTVNEYCWNNFIKGENKSNEKNIYGVFCIDSGSFILIDNTDTTVFYKEFIAMNQTITQGYGIKRPHTGLYFKFVVNTKYGEKWKVYKYGELVATIEPNTNYKPLLDKNSYCLPLPRQGEKHLFLTKDCGFMECTYKEISEKYHNNEKTDSFRKKLARNMVSNTNQYKNDLRFKSVKGYDIIVIPDELSEQDFVLWQKEHLTVNNTDNKKEYMRKYRQGKKTQMAGYNPDNLDV